MKLRSILTIIISSLLVTSAIAGNLPSIQPTKPSTQSTAPSEVAIPLDVRLEQLVKEVKALKIQVVDQQNQIKSLTDDLNKIKSSQSNYISKLQNCGSQGWENASTFAGSSGYDKFALVYVMSHCK